MRKILTLFLVILMQTSFAQQKLTFERPTYAGESIYYEGEVQNGKANGYGTATTSFKNTYKGNWKDNDYHGQGTHTWENGMQYSGSWVNGQRTGKGTHTWANGDKYEGDFVNGTLDGNGIYFFISGMKYSGSWVNGQRTGKGTHTWANGDKYEGYFVNGIFYGEGIYFFKNGEQYSGNWVNGQRTGYGKYTYANGKVDEGQFVNGVFQGGSNKNTNINSGKVTPTPSAIVSPSESKDELTILKEMTKVIQGEMVYLNKQKTNYFIPNTINLNSVDDEITLLVIFAKYTYKYSSGKSEFGISSSQTLTKNINVKELMNLLYGAGGASIVTRIRPCYQCSGQGGSWDGKSRTKSICGNCGATGCVPFF